MLTRVLRALEEEGFVSRTRHDMATGVTYALTELGQSLRRQLLVLGMWATTHDNDRWINKTSVAGRAALISTSGNKPDVD